MGLANWGSRNTLTLAEHFHIDDGATSLQIVARVGTNEYPFSAFTRWHALSARARAINSIFNRALRFLRGAKFN